MKKLLFIALILFISTTCYAQNKVKIASLDYRAGQSLVDIQLIVINSFLIGKTLLYFEVDDEFLLGVYTDDAPAAGEQRQLGVLMNMTRTSLETIISSLDLCGFQHVEDKTAIWCYKI